MSMSFGDGCRDGVRRKSVNESRPSYALVRIVDSDREDGDGSESEDDSDCCGSEDDDGKDSDVGTCSFWGVVK